MLWASKSPALSLSCSSSTDLLNSLCSKEVRGMRRGGWTKGTDGTPWPSMIRRYRCTIFHEDIMRIRNVCMTACVLVGAFVLGDDKEGGGSEPYPCLSSTILTVLRISSLMLLASVEAAAMSSDPATPPAPLFRAASVPRRLNPSLESLAAHPHDTPPPRASMSTGGSAQARRAGAPWACTLGL